MIGFLMNALDVVIFVFAIIVIIRVTIEFLR